jgi:anti-sigma B factor antagonist
MSTSSLDSEQRAGVIRVVSETAKIDAISLEGEFDMANAPALGEEIDRALEGGNNLILDLSEPTFVDSSVISVLVQAAKAASGREQAIVLQLGTAAVVERALELVEIERVLPRAHDRQEAVRIIQKEAGAV